MNITTFPRDIQKAMLIDVTAAGTHAVFHHLHTINADKYAAGLADLKDQKHTHYIHDRNAIRFALDSMGGISKAAMDFTSYLDAKGADDRKRNGTQRA
jgi:hypothetical protein